MVTAILLIVFGMLCTVAFASWSMAPWVPAWKKDLPRIFRLAQLQPQQLFYDLGCGDGRTVFYASDRCQAKAIGIELALPLYVWCRLRQLWHHSSSAYFKYGNLFRHSFSDADVVYVFGMPDKLAQKLAQKLKNELRSGARVISYTFPIAGLDPVYIDKPTPRDIAIYLYQF